MHSFFGIYNFKHLSSGNNKFAARLKSARNCSLFYNDSRFWLYESLSVSDKRGLSGPRFAQCKNSGIAVAVEGLVSGRDRLIDGIRAGAVGRKVNLGDIILALYKRSGMGFIDEIKGPAAFALYDKNQNRLIVYRDILGVRPLYFYTNNKLMVFGTTPKSILATGIAAKRINFEYLGSYFFLDGLNTNGATEFKDINNISAGNYLLVENGRVKTVPHRTPSVADLSNLSEDEITAKYRVVTETAVNRQLTRSNKTAIAFSGGFDTNLILALARESNLPVKTLTMEYESNSRAKQKDYALAETRAGKYGVKHYSVKVGPEKFLDDLAGMAPSFTRLYNLNHINLLYVYQQMAGYCQTALSGDGTEEQLSFYQYHIIPHLANIMLRHGIPQTNSLNLIKLIEKIYFELIVCRSWQWQNNRDCRPLISGLFKQDVAGELSGFSFDKIVHACLSEMERSSWVDYRGLNLLNKFLWIDFFYNLSPKMHVVSDLAFRLYGVEPVKPFIDEDFVFFSARLPSHLKMRQANGALTGKYILRKAFAPLLGEDFAFSHFKAGSDIPFEEWLVRPVFEKYIKDVLSPKKIKRHGLLNSDYINKIIVEHYHNKEMITTGGRYIKGGINHTHKILKLIGFQLWCENNF